MDRSLRIFVCLVLIVFTLVSLAACRDPYIEIGEGRTTYDGVSLRIESIDYSGEHIKLNTEWINNTLYEVVYGLDFTVERYVDGDWINCMKPGFAVIEIACVLSPLSKNDQAYSMQYADVSKEGQYRIRTTGYLHEPNEVVSCSLTCNFAVDGGYTVAEYHRVEYQIESELVEKPKQYYKAGDTVTLKIYKIMDLGFELFVNGEKLDMELEGNEYWQYSFVMPDAPVKITSRTFDGYTD